MCVNVTFYKTYEIDNKLLKFAVIVAKYENRWVFCRHKERDTYEIPGGRREQGEEIYDTARRELYEETGAMVFEIKPVCVYGVTRDDEITYGMLFTAEIKELGNLPTEFEMREILFCDKLPERLTYPQIQPYLFERVSKCFPKVQPSDASTRDIVTIKIDQKLNINGTEQFVAIRAEKPNLPLLLYLHGGPGDAALPLVLKYNKELEKHFTVVIWEQRGSGKSYYKFAPNENIRIDTYVEDIRTLVQELLARFGQDKVFLVGHSWGSVLGLLFCKKYPQLVHTYIGCGQVVNMKKSSKTAYDFAVKNADAKAVERLSLIDCNYTGASWLDDLLFVTRLVVKYKGSLYGESSYNKLVSAFLFSKDYSLRDLINRQKGSLQCIQHLWQELMDVSFEEITSFEMPIIFIEGKFDYHVSSELAKEYFDTITSNKQFFLFSNSCHFPQWSEADRFNKILIDLSKSI